MSWNLFLKCVETHNERPPLLALAAAAATAAHDWRRLLATEVLVLLVLAIKLLMGEGTSDGVGKMLLVGGPTVVAPATPAAAVGLCAPTKGRLESTRPLPPPTLEESREPAVMRLSTPAKRKICYIQGRPFKNTSMHPLNFTPVGNSTLARKMTKWTAHQAAQFDCWVGLVLIRNTRLFLLSFWRTICQRCCERLAKRNWQPSGLCFKTWLRRTGETLNRSK